MSGPTKAKALRQQGLSGKAVNLGNSQSTPLLSGVKPFRAISRAVWRTAYELEEARQHHAAAGNLWRQAWCCVWLAVFRKIGACV